VQVCVDGHAVPSNVHPIITAERILVPLRGVFEKMEASVRTQDEATVVVQRDNIAVSLPAMGRDRVMVPLRFASQALGAGVSWDDTIRIASITTPPSVASDTARDSNRRSGLGLAPAPDVTASHSSSHCPSGRKIAASRVATALKGMAGANPRHTPQTTACAPQGPTSIGGQTTSCGA
jgi:hypothetical protein